MKEGISAFDNEVRQCLLTLVELKKHKDVLGKTDYYKKEQPEVWNWAKNLCRIINKK